MNFAFQGRVAHGFSALLDGVFDELFQAAAILRDRLRDLVFVNGWSISDANTAAQGDDCRIADEFVAKLLLACSPFHDGCSGGEVDTELPFEAGLRSLAAGQLRHQPMDAEFDAPRSAHAVSLYLFR